MADIYSLLTGALNTNPEEEQQQLFQQRLAQSTSPQQFVATVGSNMGRQLGGMASRMLGGRTSQEVQSQAIQEAYRAASQNPSASRAEKMKIMSEYLGGIPGMQGIAMMFDNEVSKIQAQESQAKEAAFRAANRTREMKETREVFNPLTNSIEPRTFTWTEVYDPKEKKWVRATRPKEEESGKTSTSQTDINKNPAKEALEKRMKMLGGQPSAVDPNTPSLNVSP